MMPGALMFIKALTSLHPGAGTALGAIDLPIQREAHTQWPMIQGGSVKGVLRDIARRAENNNDEADGVVQAFGPSVRSDTDAREFAGSLAISDARLLAFPVRSLKGVYALMTCPMAIERLVSDCTLARVPAPADLQVPQVNGGQAICASDDLLFFDVGGTATAVLEDFALSRANGNSPTTSLAEWLGIDPVARLVIVHDDLFGFCVRYRTEVITRNALDPDTKTVAGRALWSEEFLPPETRMYSVLLAEQAFGGGEPEDVMANATGWFNGKSAQFGGDASTGKGICTLSLMNGAGE